MIFSSAKKGIFCLLLVVSFVLSYNRVAFGQRLKAQVKMMLERLPLQKQQKLKDLSENIETYINDYDWTGESSDEEIPITVQISLMDNSVSYEDRYSGTFLITNNSDLQYYDKYWRFPYQAGEQLIHNENVFDPFTGFINFYVYLIIGGEYDKYGRFLGTPYFEKAKHICGQAKFNSLFRLGWDERSKLVDKILSKENKPFRTMEDLFFLGLSYVDEEDSTARKYCGQALSLLDEILTKDPYNKQARQFLNAHYLKYTDILKDDREAMEKLVRLDPNHAKTYRKAMKSVVK